MKQFKPSLITAALITSGLAFVSSSALAQQQNAEESANDVEVIQVSGIRASLQKARAIKMSETSIVEAITAEDIGKLPDSSIAESLARLPGLAAQRLDGRASSLSIRGLGENFSATTFNGREQVSLGDNRGVEFDVYPSEIMNEVVVYKTPEASLITQGIGGTVDMRTIKPLAHGEQTISFTLRGENNDIGKLNPDGEDTGIRGSFSYIDQFNDDTLGVAFAYAHMSSPINEERFNTWGWPEADGNSVIGGFKPYVRSAELKRDTFMGVIEYAPNDDLEINIDALYIDFKDDQILRGAEIPAQWGDAGLTQGQVVDGFVRSGTIGSAGNPVGVVVRNDVTIREADLTAVGFNAQYALDDSWSVEFDASYSKVKRRTWALETYAGSGRGKDGRLPETIDFVFSPDNRSVKFNTDLNYGDDSVIKLGNPQGWGWGNLIDPDSSDDQDGFINTPEVEDEMTTIKLAAEKVMDSGMITSVQFGLNYSDRSKSKDDQGLFLTLPQTIGSDGKVIPGSQVAIPAEYRLPNVSMDFIGINQLVAFDAFRFWQDGNYRTYDSRITDPARHENTWVVDEKVTTAFVKANIETEIGDLPIRGNVGVQVVQTDQSSTGTSSRRLNDSAPAGVDGRTLALTPTRGGDKYTEVLPSLNLIADIADDQLIRLGLARTMSRSRMDRMNASSGDLSYNNEANVWSGKIANPELRPVMADQIDITYENYFHEEAYFAVAGFYKSLDNWQQELPKFVNTSGLTPPAGEPVAPLGVLSQWQNVGDGEVSGLEFSLALAGGMFHDSLEGLGGIFSATFLDSEIDYSIEVPTDLNGGTELRTDTITVPGLSKKVYNATVYYERQGFEARVSWRKRTNFLGEVSGLSLVRQPVNVFGSTIVDAQISYDFSESNFEALHGLTVSLQGQNLTDEEFVTAHSPDGTRDIRDVQRFGRNFLFGINYQF